MEYKHQKEYKVYVTFVTDSHFYIVFLTQNPPNGGANESHWAVEHGLS